MTPDQFTGLGDRTSPTDDVPPDTLQNKTSKTGSAPEDAGRHARPATPQQAPSQQELHSNWREVSMAHRQQHHEDGRPQPQRTVRLTGAGSSTDVTLPNEETFQTHQDAQFTVDTLPWGQRVSTTQFAPEEKERDPNERWTLYLGDISTSFFQSMMLTPWTNPVNIARRLRVGHMADPDATDYVFVVTHTAPDNPCAMGGFQYLGAPTTWTTPADQYGDRSVRRKLENLRREPQAIGAIPLTDTDFAPPTIGVWLYTRTASMYRSVYPREKIIEALPIEYERLLDEYRRHEEERKKMADPPPPVTVPVTATCWERR